MKQSIKENRAIVKAVKELKKAFFIVESKHGFHDDDFAKNRTTLIVKLEGFVQQKKILI